MMVCSTILDFPFLVIATQNPIEQEGTYRLPEAQLDRFLFKVNLHYPTLEEEKEILIRFRNKHDIDLENVQSLFSKSELKDDTKLHRAGYIRRLFSRVYCKYYP